MLNLFAVFVFSAAAAAPAAPFWKAKAKVYERIQNGEVIVSVSQESEGAAPQARGAPVGAKKSTKHQLLINGGGIVNAPCAFVFREALNFEEIARTSGYIREPDYDAATHMLSFTVSAFFHSTAMKVKVESQSEPQPAYIDSTVVEGPTTGLYYRLQFEPIASAKCEVGIHGDYAYDEFPIHRLFLQFGLEVVFQSMAKRLRSHVESRYIRPH